MTEIVKMRDFLGFDVVTQCCSNYNEEDDIYKELCVAMLPYHDSFHYIIKKNRNAVRVEKTFSEAIEYYNSL